MKPISPTINPKNNPKKNPTVFPKTYLDELSRKQFTLDWYKELGWKDNPFKNKILEPLEYFFTGYEEERQKLNYFIIQNQSFGTIGADKGCGSTTMGLWLRDELLKYKGRTPCVYISLTGLGSVDFLHTIITSVIPQHELAIITAYHRLGAADLQKRIGKKIKWEWLSKESFFSSIAHRRYTSLDAIRAFLSKKLKDKSLIIILDDAAHMHKQHAQILQSFFYAHLPIQVVAVGTKEALSKAPLRIIQKKDALRIRLAKLSPKEVYDMIAKRILFYGGQTPIPISEAVVKKFYEKYEKNPRQILSACQDYCVKIALEQLRQRKGQGREQGKEQTWGKKSNQERGGAQGEKAKSAGKRIKNIQMVEQHSSIEQGGPSSIEQGPSTHPFTGEKLSKSSSDSKQENAGSRPSFEIPLEILKQIEEEEAAAKIQAKKDAGRKKNEAAYRIKVHTNEPTDEEVAIVETLVEDPKEESKIKTNSSRRKKK